MADDTTVNTITLLKLNMKDRVLEVLGKRLKIKHTEVKVLLDGDPKLVEALKFNEIEVVANYVE